MDREGDRGRADLTVARPAAPAIPRPRSTAPPQGWWTSLAARLWPRDVAVPMPWWLVAGALVLVPTLTVLRLGGVASLDSVWAEDGRVFLDQATTMSPAEALVHPYAGYMHAVPRLLAWGAATLPLRAAPAALVLGAALVSALLALLVYRVTSGHIRSAAVRLALAAYVAVLPFAWEVVGNVANLHWLLLFASFCVLMWDPRSVSGQAVGATVLLLTATSDPMGAALLPLALLRLLVLGRRGWVFAGALAVGVVVQGVVMLTAPERALHPTAEPFRLAGWYVGRVLAWSVFGERLGGDGGVRGLALGLLVVAAVVVTVQALRPEVRRRVRPFVALCLVCSVALYLLLAGLSGVDTGRYAVPSSLLVVLALATALGQATGDRPLAQWVGRARSSAPVAVAVVMLVAWVVALPVAGPRTVGPRWGAELARAARVCTATAAQQVPVQIRPAGWSASVPCQRLRGS